MVGWLILRTPKGYGLLTFLQSELHKWYFCFIFFFKLGTERCAVKFCTCTYSLSCKEIKNKSNWFHWGWHHLQATVHSYCTLCYWFVFWLATAKLQSWFNQQPQVGNTTWEDGIMIIYCGHLYRKTTCIKITWWCEIVLL